jgi:hypothetical protein
VGDVDREGNGTASGGEFSPCGYNIADEAGAVDYAGQLGLIVVAHLDLDAIKRRPRRGIDLGFDQGSISAQFVGVRADDQSAEQVAQGTTVQTKRRCGQTNTGYAGVVRENVAVGIRQGVMSLVDDD